MYLKLSFAAIFFVIQLVRASHDPQVTISSGSIIGELIQTSQLNSKVNRFLGLPYAEPPVGKLRFRKPQPLNRKWTEPLQATSWQDNCVQFMQHPMNVALLPALRNQNISEDCLYLNVWSPKLDSTEEELLPVLVWIHGGALILGTSSLDPYDGEELAARTNSVVVTINYRLSALGFMVSTEVPEITGNQGFYDQALALEWVQENIRYFGGNPNQVTIMGESAGSWSVSAHILSPVSRNLFQQGVMMSGALISDKFVTKPEIYEKHLLTAIRKVNCASEADSTINQKVLECLEQLDPTLVDMLAYTVDKDPLDLLTMPVVDGHFFPAKPTELLSTGNYKTNIRLLFSTVEDEASFIFTAFPQFREKNPEPLTLDQAKAFLASFAQDHFIYKPVPEELVSKIYFSGLTNLDPQDSFRAKVGVAFGDFLLGCPTIEFGKQVFEHSKISGSGPEAEVYQWHYRAKIGSNKLIQVPWTSGALHGDDIFPVFGIGFRHPEQATNRERDIAVEVMGFIGEFAKNGKPGNQQWLPFFRTDDEQVISPYYELKNEYSTSKNYKFNLKQLECGSIWNRYNN